MAEEKKVKESLKSQINVAFENTVMCARAHAPADAYAYAKRMAEMVIRLIEEDK